MAIFILLSLYLGLVIRSLVAFLSVITTSSVTLSHSLQEANISDSDYASRSIVWIVALGIIASFLIGNKGKSTILWWFLLLVLVVRFFSRKLFLFYVVFELRLIPILLIILFFGTQPERLSARLYFIMYTIVLSLPFMANVLLVMPVQSYFLKVKMRVSLRLRMLLIAPFLVKIPVLGVHFWLPKAHVEARTSGSMVLAGLLLKLGSYGVVRILYLLPFLRKGWIVAPWLITAGLRGVITLAQSDIKKLIAYRRVAHMTFIIVGAISNSKLIIMRVIMISLAHSWASIGIFSRAGRVSTGRSSRLRRLLRIESSLHWITLSVGFILVVNSSIPPMLSFFPEIIMLIRMARVSPLLLPMFMALSLVVCYYNAYLFILLLNTKESLSLNFIRVVDSNRIVLIVITRIISLVWLINCFRRNVWAVAPIVVPTKEFRVWLRPYVYFLY